MFKHAQGVSNSISQKSKFDLLLLLFFVDERTHTQRRGDLRKWYHCLHSEGTGKPPLHAEIHNLERDLKQLYSNKELNGINLYLYGLVLREQERSKDARKIFIECLNEFPYLWSAWIELCKII